MSWIAQNWHLVWGLACLAAFIVLMIYSRRNPEAVGARAFFRLVPFADPTGRAPRGLTHRAVVLWLIGLLILLLAIIFVPGFA